MTKKVRQPEPENPWHLGIQEMSLKQALANPDVRQHVLWDLEGSSPALRSLSEPKAKINKAIAAKAESMIDKAITYVWKNGYDLDQIRVHDTSDRHFLERSFSRKSFYARSWYDLYPVEVRQLGIVLGSMTEHFKYYTIRQGKQDQSYRHYYFIMPKHEVFERARRELREEMERPAGWRPGKVYPEDVMARCARLGKKGKKEMKR
jgi:hypothetical protein